MAFGTTQANEILDSMIRRQAYTVPPGLYCSLHESDPGATGAGETTYTGYVRLDVGTGYFTSAASAKSLNNNAAAITFGQNTGSSVNITHVGLSEVATGTALSASNFLCGGAVDSSPVAVGTNATPEFAAAALTVTLT